MSYITAIIPSFVDVDKQYLKVCVESLRTAGFDGDITVVANGTKDMNPLHDCPIKGITKFLVTKQQGQCNAVNQGAKMVEGDCKYLLVSNSDMYYAPGWDKHLSSYQDENHKFKYLCMSPNLVEPTNNPGSAEPFLKLDAGFTLDEFKQDEVNKFVKKHKDNKVEPGFNLPFIIDIELWRNIGGYDTKYDPWGSNSDTDLQTLINFAGVKPVRLRDVLVYHFSNKSGTFDGSHQDAWQQNWDYYYQKWGFTRDQLGSDVWTNKKMLPKNKEDIKFQAEWHDKYHS